MSRRSAGEGSVHRSPDGSGWVAMIELPKQGDGRRRRRKRRATTRAEAQKLLRQMRDEIHQTGAVSSAQRTIREGVEDYLAVRASENLSDGAREDDTWLSGLILDGLGARRAAQLTVVDCDQFLAECTQGLNGRRSIGRDRMARIRRFLIAVLRNEMRTDTLARNVAELSVLPANEGGNSERRALTKVELDRLLDTAQGSRLIIIDLCARNGLRPAEARALRWQDVDLDRWELSVRGQQSKKNQRTDTKRAHNSARTIQLDRATFDRLKAWVEEQDTMRAQAGLIWHNLDILASTKVGTPVDRHSLARSLRLLCRKIEIEPPVAPYELRHTAISHQADAGASAWEIADWAGTSEAMISRVYRHQMRRISVLRPLPG